MPRQMNPMRPIVSLLLFCCFSLFLPELHATHNRAGEIRVEQIGDCNALTIRATIVTYTRASSVQADRDTLELLWGDGTSTRIGRSNGVGNEGEFIGNDFKRNLYIAEHTYPGRSTYVLSMTDPNRIEGIVNIPNSVNIAFHLSTTYTFLNPQFQGCNSTPELLQPPVDRGCVGFPFIHNPNAYDPDGDSLSYQLIEPLQAVNTDVPNYIFPDRVAPGPNNNLTIDEVTGDIVWDAPQLQGEYNLAMIIVEWRNGIPIDTTIRDMQITIGTCQQNLPPEIEVPFEEICVIAGEVVEFDVIATAPLQDEIQRVQLQVFGGPMILNISPATLTNNNTSFAPQPSVKQFRWETACEHISDQAYSIVFRAADDFRMTEGLATLKTVRIKVVGPPPDDVEAISRRDEVRVSWENPYACEVTQNDYFKGFSVWRRLGSNPFSLDSCQGGLEEQGYDRLAFNYFETDEDGARYEYIDTELERGQTYCYRILGEFARTSPNGNYNYNRIASLPSEEVCIQRGRDVPLITNVDVQRTGENDGAILVRWSKPNAQDLDTLQNPPPYRYQVWRAVDINGTDFELITTTESSSFATANDTTFLDANLNTLAEAHTYKVAFFVNGEDEALGETPTASSIFLAVAATDRRVNLSWQDATPWVNRQYVVYEVRDSVQTVLDTVSTTNYIHEGLVNGETYCYRIESIGSYGIDNILEPILNFSQQLCAIPQDNVPPCSPELSVQNICNKDDNINITPNDFENSLEWTNPNDTCTETDDVAGYNIYYAPTQNDVPQALDFVNGASNTFYSHAPENSIAGCYTVTAVDELFKESAPSKRSCEDNCPIYELPNTFTPNGDGQNDIFIPYAYRFVERIELQVFNRWGQLVFETTDPDINWTGDNLNGEGLADGVYHYTCIVYENRVAGIVQQSEVLKGFIQLIR
ncbi:MAG: gliding motility-associated C-terminal domain-containing protein [Bacteroidota bacterium]